MDSKQADHIVEYLFEITSHKLERRKLKNIIINIGLVKLISLSIMELMHYGGFSEEIARQIFYSLRIGREILEFESGLNKSLTSSENVFKYLLAHIGVPSTEEFWILGLNVRQQPLHINLIAKGTHEQVGVSLPEIFGLILRHGSPRLICCHTHPSGDPSPSEEDLILTDKIIESSKFLGISFIDHIIMGHGGYFSLADKGYI